MRRLKITIKPESAFNSKLQSDTIFGQFCWMLRDLGGDEKLERVLYDYKHKPFIVFSDGFPAGMLPIPIMPNFFTDSESIIKAKELKNKSFIKSNILLKILSSLTPRSLLNAIYADDTDNTYSKQSIVYKNSISRITGTTTKGGASLYHCNEILHHTDIDIYALYDEESISRQEIVGILTLMGKTGFGKDKSTGKGRFNLQKVIDDPEELAPVSDNPSIFISLGNGIADACADLLYGKILTKFGKHGGAMASEGKHIKNPVIMYKAGSIFTINSQKEAYGAGLELNTLSPGHFHSAWMLPLFGRLGVENE